MTNEQIKNWARMHYNHYVWWNDSDSHHFLEWIYLTDEEVESWYELVRERVRSGAGNPNFLPSPCEATDIRNEYWKKYNLERKLQGKLPWGNLCRKRSLTT